MSTRKFPKSIPSTAIGELDFEVGFALENVQGITNDSELLCSICHALPRRPLELRCGHFFCHTCITQLIVVSNGARRRLLPSGHQKAACPICRKEFSVLDITDESNFQTTFLRLFNAIRVRCPFGCDYEGDPKTMDKHQRYSCPERPIRCPNYLCPVIGTATVVENGHYADCEYYRLFCPRCTLAVPHDELETHDCVKRQQQALNKFYQHFLSHGGKINPLCVPGKAGAPMYVISFHERDDFQDKVKDDGEESDMSDSDVTALENMLPLPDYDAAILDDLASQ